MVVGASASRAERRVSAGRLSDFAGLVYRFRGRNQILKHAHRVSEWSPTLPQTWRKSI